MGSGGDSLNGGGGIDTFVYTAAPESWLAGFDTIVNFNPADDTIDIRGLALVDGPNDVLNKGAIAPLSGNSNNFFINGSTQHDVAYGQSGTDTFVYIDANRDGSFQTDNDLAIKITNFSGTLTDGDFLLS